MQMKKNQKIKIKKSRVLAVILVVGVLLGLFYMKTRNKLQVVTVISEIGDYHYTLESNTTRIYKKYYKELEKELADNRIDEENYASLISKLFVIDYYTLSNKITNKNIGGTEFIHSNLKDRFIKDSSDTIYKYIENNLYGNRKQNLPEVNEVEVEKISQIKYQNDSYHDDSAYQVEIKVGYVKDYDYPKKVVLTIIHEENKLAFIEIK